MNFNKESEALGGKTQVQPGEQTSSYTITNSRDDIFTPVGMAYSITDNVCSVRTNNTAFVKVLDDIVDQQKCGRVVSYGITGNNKMFQFAKPVSWAVALMEEHNRARKKGGVL